MRTSYILSAWNGKVTLRPEILEQLNLSRQACLYGVPVDDVDGGDGAVLSTIPVAKWPRAYRLSLYTAAPPGSLAGVTKVLADLGINIFSSWAAAISPDGELCFTATVDLPLKVIRLGERRARAGSAYDGDRNIEEYLLRKLRSQAPHCLSKSRIYNSDGELALVRMRKLRVLTRIYNLAVEAKAAERHVEIDDWTLDLKSAAGPDQKPCPLFSSVDADLSGRSLVLLTPDTEERFIRVSPMRSSRYRKISCPLEITSAGEDFTGYLENAVQVLAGPKLRLNLFGARTVVSKRTVTEAVAGATAKNREDVRFEFTVDLGRRWESGDGKPGVKKDSDDLKSLLHARIQDALQKHAKTKQSDVAMRLDDFDVVDLFQASPLVFLATNVKPETNTKPGPLVEGLYRFFAINLIHLLESKGLVPVNVDISVGRSLRREVEDLLRICPLLVSLHVPEPGNKLASGNRYTPSDYTMYEEAFMFARRTRVIRLRHEDVFSPRFVGDQIEHEFTDTSFEQTLGKVGTVLDRILSMPDFRLQSQRCDELKFEYRDRWKQRNLFEWLTKKPPNGPAASDEQADVRGAGG